MHRIYLAATMGYGLGSDDPEELAYYKKLNKEMDDIKKDAVKKGIPLRWDIQEGMDKWIWIPFYWLMEVDVFWSAFADDS